MIQKSPSRHRPRRSRSTPTTSEIARKRQEIREEWSMDERSRRSGTRRLDQGDSRLNAHLRFIEFLLATQNESARQEPSRRRKPKL
ncbi:MAG TPA: hypothetical protein VNQ76_13185 [Planctomicrobium sp.]|nr:hypothetical protein [Planctomicrobium sp.]